MKITVLVTDLFPDQATLQAALRELATEHQITCLDARAPEDDASRWDSVLETLLDAERIVTV